MTNIKEAFCDTAAASDPPRQRIGRHL